MKLRIACVALAIALAPTLSFASGCSHDKQAMSCAAGSTYDAETGSCVDATT
jgi:hypothetical protein